MIGEDGQDGTGSEDEWKHMELEDKKIINKKRKRVDKIEDCNLDIEAFFRNKKRFKPDDSDCATQCEI